MKKHIPNILTSCNILSGLGAIYFAAEAKLEYASLAIAIASVFDFLDGMSARILHTYSAIGKQLDSLADMVSFGVAPSFIMLQMMANSPCLPHWSAKFPAFLLALAAAWRLAKFNLDNTQSHSFKGLPSPAAALLIAALPFTVSAKYAYPIASLNCYPKQLGMTILVAWAMVSSIPLLSLKVQNFRWQDNWGQYSLLLISIILFIGLGITAILPIAVLYILISLVQWATQKKTATKN